MASLLSQARKHFLVTLTLSGLLVIMAGGAFYLTVAHYLLDNKENSYTQQAELTTFSQSGVTVHISLQKDSQGGLILAATYTPLKAGFHLYGKDLAATGIDGAGRPTRLELISAQHVQSRGDLFADLPAHDYIIVGFDRPFPIYPEGPVTLSLPVKMDPLEGQTATATIDVSYMACSVDGVCLPPVNRELPVIIKP